MVISLVLVIGCFSSSCATVEKRVEEANENHEIAEEKIQIDYDFEVEDGTEPVGFIGYKKILNGFYVYDSEHLEMIYGENGATANDCLNVIKNNPDIPQKFKPYFIDFVKRISQKYPEASLDTLYHNLKTLKVEELSSMKYVVKSWSDTSLGCYRLDDNAIYIPEGTEYIEGEFGFQVLIHEFCHAARCCWVDGKMLILHPLILKMIQIFLRNV